MKTLPDLNPAEYEVLERLGVLEKIEALRLNSRNLEELLQEATDIFSKGSLDALVETVTHCLVEKFVPSYLVFLLQNTQGTGVRVIAYRNMRQIDPPLHMRSLRTLEDFFKDHPRIVEFEQLAHEFPDNREVQEMRQVNPEIVVPVTGFSGLYGLILVGSRVVGGRYENNELEYMDRLMRFTTIAIQNNIHYENSVTDLKTGLYNNSFFVQRVREEIAKAKRYGSRFSMLILDLDHFKHLNDTYGHLAGDQVLVQIARLIKMAIRTEDVAARFGGEEFTVLLCETDNYGAHRSSERIRRSIENHVFDYRGKMIKVTVSIGCCALDLGETDDYREILRRADSALYSAKARGRNQTCIYRPGLLYRATKAREGL
ncbi:MAG: GGDEF domain-containing protein [Spirochaetota bacterium]